MCCLCRSVCVLSTAIKGKENFHLFVGVVGLYKWEEGKKTPWEGKAPEVWYCWWARQS